MGNEALRRNATLDMFNVFAEISFIDDQLFRVEAIQMHLSWSLRSWRYGELFLNGDAHFLSFYDQ